MSVLPEAQPILDALRGMGKLTDEWNIEDTTREPADRDLDRDLGTRYGKPRRTPKIPRKLKKRLYGRVQPLGLKRMPPIVISGTW